MSSYPSASPYFFPLVFATGFAGSGPAITTPLPSSPNLAGLLEGIDVWPLVVPQTATITFTVPAPNPVEAGTSVFGVYQTSSDVGPWSWRGAVGMPFRGQDISIVATGSFAFNLWGRQIPDWGTQ